MFTGIVEERGMVDAGGSRLSVRSIRIGEDLTIGESVCVSGACLTVVERRRDRSLGFGAVHMVRSRHEWLLSFDLSPETLARTSLGALAPGDPVNLERSATLTTRLGGHLVQGHVDGVGTIVDIREAPPGKDMRIRLPDDLARYVVEKGSITVDGVSLTVTGVAGDEFGVALIPYTLEATTLGSAKVGDRVNLEGDVIAKYVERLMKETR
jgi:riboflavin synthase